MMGTRVPLGFGPVSLKLTSVTPSTLTVSSLPSHSLSGEVKESPLLLSLPAQCPQIWSLKTSPGFLLIHLTDSFEYLVWFEYCSRDWEHSQHRRTDHYLPGRYHDPTDKQEDFRG